MQLENANATSDLAPSAPCCHPGCQGAALSPLSGLNGFPALLFMFSDSIDDLGLPRSLLVPAGC